MYKDNKQRLRGRDLKNGEDERINIGDIIKDIEFLSSTHMTWKEKKALENKKAVSLGGKAQKKERLTLGVAKGRMKKQKQREEQMQKERMILGSFGGKYGRDSMRSLPNKRRPEERVLKSTEGTFKNGVLNVKHLLHRTPSNEFHTFSDMTTKGKNQETGKEKGRERRAKARRAVARNAVEILPINFLFFVGREQIICVVYDYNIFFFERSL